MAHIPIRTCISCNSKKPKKDLIKINIENKGRGAYICHSIDCLEKAYKLKKFDENVYERLKGNIVDR